MLKLYPQHCDRQGYAGKHYYDKGGPLKWQK